MPILIKGSGGVQEKPSVSVSSSGLITATAGDEKTTKQLSSSDDADFVAGNIKSGVSIFGVTGSLKEGYKMAPCTRITDSSFVFSAEDTVSELTLVCVVFSYLSPYDDTRWENVVYVYSPEPYEVDDGDFYDVGSCLVRLNGECPDTPVVSGLGTNEISVRHYENDINQSSHRVLIRGYCIYK